MGNADDRDRMGDELDYRLEAEAQGVFAETFADSERYVVPRVLASMLVAVLLNGLVSVVGVAGGYFFNVILQGGTPGDDGGHEAEDEADQRVEQVGQQPDHGNRAENGFRPIETARFFARRVVQKQTRLDVAHLKERQRGKKQRDQNA